MGDVEELVNELRHVRRNGVWGAAKPRAQHAHPLCVQAADALTALQARLAAVGAERDVALSRIEDVHAANAGNFDSEGKYWRGYDQACLDCHAALKGTDHG